MPDVEQPDRTVGPVAAEREAQLHARISELEDQLIDTEAWANRAVAEAQERVYWLDRWHIDLNALMERPGASEFRACVRAVRAVYRLVLRIKTTIDG